MDIKDQSKKTPLATWYDMQDALKSGVRKFQVIGSLIDASDSDALLRFTNGANSFTRPLRSTLNQKTQSCSLLRGARGKESSYIDIYQLH